MPVFNNPTLAASGGGQRLPLMKPDAVRGRLLVSLAGGSGSRDWEEYPAGRTIVPDFGHRLYGGISFEPFAKHVVPDGASPPEIPDTVGRKWQRIYEFPVLDEELGTLFMFSVTSPLDKASINQNRIASIITMWGYAAQAARGLLQRFKTCPFSQVDTANGVFHGLVWEPTDQWIDRNEPPFPQRLQPPPSPILSGPPAPQKLPPTPPADSAAAEEPVKGPSTGQPPPPLARFRPATERAPY